MSFTSPDRLVWLLVAVPIIGFYILKTRLRRRQVSTLLFWDQLFEEKRQRTLWQNLRHWLSLLLQLVIVSVVVLALLDPVFGLRDDEGQELILIVDRSASMRAIDSESGKSRLDQAIDRAGELAAGLRIGDHAALLTAGSSVNVVVGLTDFAPAIQDGLQSIEPTDGPTKMDDAIRAARRLANDPQRRRIVVFSDMSLPEPPKNDDDLRLVQVGSSTNNVAITQFQARRSTVDPIGYALLVEVSNFGDQPATGRLKLELGESLVDMIPYSLEPDENWRTTIDGTSREGGILQASINSDDGFLPDNLARAIIPERPAIPVRLITDDEDEAYYLRNVLSSIPLLELIDQSSQSGDSLRVSASAASDAAMDSKGVSAAALTVYSNTVPERLPDGPTLIVSPQQDGPVVTGDAADAPAWTLGEPIESPLIAKQDDTSPLLTHVQLTNVLLDGGRDVQVSESFAASTKLLETAEGAAVLVSVDRPKGRLLILSTDLDSGDLPLRIAFPVMMTNAVNWFLRRTNEIQPALSTGEVTDVPWDVATEGDEAVLVGQTGKRRRVTVENRRASIGPIDHIGVYGLYAPTELPRLSSTNESVPDASDAQGQFPANQDSIGQGVAVNLCNAQESDLRLTAIPELAEESLPPAGFPGWLWLLFAAIGLVLAEWALFNRRVVA